METTTPMAVNANLWEIYSDLIIKQGAELLKKEEVKANLKEQYRTIIHTIFAEIGIYLYLLVGSIVFIFIMLSVILIMLVVRTTPFGVVLTAVDGGRRSSGSCSGSDCDE